MDFRTTKRTRTGSIPHPLRIDVRNMIHLPPAVRSSVAAGDVLTQQIAELDGLLLDLVAGGGLSGSGGHLWILGTLKGALTKGCRGLRRFMGFGRSENGDG